MYDHGRHIDARSRRRRRCTITTAAQVDHGGRAGARSRRGRGYTTTSEAQMDHDGGADTRPQRPCRCTTTGRCRCTITTAAQMYHYDRRADAPLRRHEDARSQSTRKCTITADAQTGMQNHM